MQPLVGGGARTPGRQDARTPASLQAARRRAAGQTALGTAQHSGAQIAGGGNCPRTQARHTGPGQDTCWGAQA